MNLEGGQRFHDGDEGWSLEPRMCDSCKASPATLFCRADSAFLCLGCDGRVHGANRLASRHERVWMCEVCEHAPASVTCKADAAALCVACDRDIHSANPLAQRHERVPVVPFYNPAEAAEKMSGDAASGFLVPSVVVSDGLLGGTDLRKEHVVEDRKEITHTDDAEAASWLSPNPKLCVDQEGELKSGDYFFHDVDPYNLDLAYSLSIDHRFHHNAGSEIVVPVHNKLSPRAIGVNQITGSDTASFPSKVKFTFRRVSLSQSNSVSSSSLDIGVVPDGSSVTDVSNPYDRSVKEPRVSDLFPPTQSVPHYSPLDREARVLRYREKKKNRKFQKTIRYASRKAYAETRPRIKGRFAKRAEIELEVDRIYSAAGAFLADSGYGLVPSF